MRNLVVTLLFALSGCAASAADVVPPEEASLELGTGTYRFEPIEDGAEVPMVRGAQGGWHLWVAIRTSGLASRAGSLTIEHQLADESEPASTTSIGVQLDPPDAEGRRAYLGWAAILADPSCTVGELVRVRATFTSSSGARISDERYVVAGGGELPPPPCLP